MPSLNIKDYIIAGLLLIVIGCGVTIFYDRIKIDYLERYKEKAEQLTDQQKIRIKLLEENSQKTEEYLNEKYEVELGILNNTINRLRDHNSSLLSSIPKSTSNPNRICFDREKLNKGLREFTNELQEITRRGQLGITGLNICKEWIEKEEQIYNEN